MIQHIQRKEFPYLVKRLVQENEWTEEEAKEAIRKYKNFLVLRYKYPKTSLVPTKEIDEVWHAHILHTKEYTKDCQRFFGKYLHHNPASGASEEKKRLKKSYENTTKLYWEEFKEPYFFIPLEASDF